MNTIKILLDTDIGSDIDDAVCLAYLLSEPRCELLGITTVTGEPEKRAMIASALCKAASRDIPVFPGSAYPLFSAARQPSAPQAAALERWPHQSTFPRGEAIEFMRTTIRRYPGEIDLLCIGPLTNIALLFAIDPEIPYLLKSLVLMCGIFHHRLTGLNRHECEWNAQVDPHAAAMVYRAVPFVHRSIGLDVTCRITMDATEIRNRFRGRILEPVLDFAGYWFEKTPVLTFHDPLAAVTLFDPQVCTFEQGNVEIELESERLKGKTIWNPGTEKSPHEIAVDVDVPRFFSTFFGAFENSVSGDALPLVQRTRSSRTANILIS